MSIVRSKNEIEIMAEGGKILARVMREVKAEVRPGKKLKELDDLAFRLIEESGAKPAFLDYQPEGADRPYPSSICASVNEVAVHGIPGDYVIRDGDLVKLDFGVRYRGFCTDAATTVAVGEVSAEAKKLAKVTEEALHIAIKQMRPGNTLGDVSAAIQGHVEKNGFQVIRDLTGHGIGRKLHEEPSVYNFGKPGTGEVLKAGTTFAIEPITAISATHVRQLPDDSFVTSDRSLSAHFEHTIVVTEGGARILTIL